MTRRPSTRRAGVCLAPVGPPVDPAGRRRPPALIVLVLSAVLVACVVGHLWWALASVAVLLGCLGSAWYTAHRGSAATWNWLLDEFEFAGDEQVLDIGCGDGAVLLSAASRLPRGHAVGVERWHGVGRVGGALARTRRGAAELGITERIGLCGAELGALPFADRSFDLVVSNVAVHGLGGWAERSAAIAEAVRVLRPGGRLVITDVRGTARYRAQLTEAGLVGVTRRDLGWRMWWSGPWLTTHAVGAAKAYV